MKGIVQERSGVQRQSSALYKNIHCCYKSAVALRSCLAQSLQQLLLLLLLLLLVRYQLALLNPLPLFLLQEDALLAYQVCFDLFENEMQAFSTKVLPLSTPYSDPDPAEWPPSSKKAQGSEDEGRGERRRRRGGGKGSALVPKAAGCLSADSLALIRLGQVRMEMDKYFRQVCGEPAEEPKEPEADVIAAPAAEDNMETDAPASDAAAAPAEGEEAKAEEAKPEDTPEVASYRSRFGNLKGIITGTTPIGLYLEFLHSKNKSDLQILKNIKAAVESRNSVCHSAAIVANALMHSGTTIDTFLRDNLEWLGRATNWAKFTATAGLGVIHKGHLTQGKALMEPYLPGYRASASPYSEGGALYALGLIHANHGADIRTFLLESLRQTSNECIQHGACLGLGLAGMGTEDEELFEDVKTVLYTDSAVAGEAAGIAMGLLQVGTASDKAQEMLAYAHDTQHEKIIRGLAVGLAMIMFGREEGAEILIEQLTHDQDSILRYGGMFVIGMAYTGTSNNAAIQKLLHFAVSDVSDDVRRAAVTNLGFVLASAPEQCPAIVSLLAESFNPHVRYGAAMAVGVSCAGMGLKEAVALLEPMLNDAVDFVRQGALLAMALVMMQQPESRSGSFRKHVDKVINDKHEETMCKMGAILAAGILDGGGRNVTVTLRSGTGQFRLTSAVGLCTFLQVHPPSLTSSLAGIRSDRIPLLGGFAPPICLCFGGRQVGWGSSLGVG